MPSLKPLHAIVIALVVAVLALLPLAFVTVPPMVDYPNHLARCAILANLPSSAALRAMYEPRGELLPNLAMDAVVVPLAHVMSPFAAGKVFCALVILGTLGGGVALSYALNRRITLWSFAPALLLYHHILIYGFVNYLFGLALMLLGLAAWIRMREGRLVPRLLVGGAFAAALFLSHLIALFLFGLAVAGFEVARWLDAPGRDLRGLLRSAAGVAAIFVLPAVLLARSPTHAEASAYHASSLGDKVDMLPGILRTDGNRLDALFSLVVLLAVAGLVATRTLVLARSLRLSALALGAAFLLLPEMFATCACVDIRIPIALLLLLASGSEISLPRGAGFSLHRGPGLQSDKARRLAPACLSLLALAFVGRSYQIARDWRIAERGSQAVLNDLSNLPDRATVFLAADDDEPIFNERAWSPPLVHLAVAEGVERPLFFPQIFALPRQHPLAVRPELRALEKFQDTEPFDFDDHKELQGVLDRVHREAASLTAVPPNLGPDPAFYLFVLTQPSKPLAEEGWRDARLIVRRPRYALFRMTNLETAALARRRYWDAQKRRRDADRVARF